MYRVTKPKKNVTRKDDRLQKLYFEPTSLCNLNCTMCFRRSWIDEQYGNLDIALFRKVMEEPMVKENTETVFFGGQGEPLIHPDIFEMIRIAKSGGKNVELITNGTTITGEVCEKLISLGLDTLWVSIDSFDPDGYKKIQVGSDFGRIVENILTFNELRKNTETRLGVTFVLMKSNVLQLLEFEKFTDYVMADRVNFSNMIPTTPEMEKESFAYKTVLQEYGHPKPIGGRKSDRVALVRFFDEDLKETPEIIPLLNQDHSLLWKGQVLERRFDNCRFIDEGTTFVRWDGDVSPCMELLHSSKSCLYGDFRTVMHYSFGNIGVKTLTQIWESDEYTEFRKKVDEYSYAPCVSCGGCQKRLSNLEDCIGNVEPSCGACLWGQGIAQCP